MSWSHGRGSLLKFQDIQEFSGDSEYLKEGGLSDLHIKTETPVCKWSQGQFWSLWRFQDSQEFTFFRKYFSGIEQMYYKLIIKKLKLIRQTSIYSKQIVVNLSAAHHETKSCRPHVVCEMDGLWCADHCVEVHTPPRDTMCECLKQVCEFQESGGPIARKRCTNI